MISLLNGLLEGPKPVAVAARIIRQLELTRIPELLNDVLIEVRLVSTTRLQLNRAGLDCLPRLMSTCIRTRRPLSWS